jgi:hypothetical protein
MDDAQRDLLAGALQKQAAQQVPELHFDLARVGQGAGDSGWRVADSERRVGDSVWCVLDSDGESPIRRSKSGTRCCESAFRPCESGSGITESAFRRRTDRAAPPSPRLGATSQRLALASAAFGR